MTGEELLAAVGREALWARSRLVAQAECGKPVPEGGQIVAMGRAALGPVEAWLREHPRDCRVDGKFVPMTADILADELAALRRDGT